MLLVKLERGRCLLNISMAGGKNNNKVKRKRGKKFRFYGDTAKAASEAEANPFEDHSSSKKASRDKLKVSCLSLNIGGNRDKNLSKSSKREERTTYSLTKGWEEVPETHTQSFLRRTR